MVKISRHNFCVFLGNLQLTMSRTLAIILSETRAHELTYTNFKTNVLDALNADLCVCIGIKDDYDYTNPFYENAKFKFTFNEPDDFGDAFDFAVNEISIGREKYETFEGKNALHGTIRNPTEPNEDITFYGKSNNTAKPDVDGCVENVVVVHSHEFPDKLWQNCVHGIRFPDDKVVDWNKVVVEPHVTTFVKPLSWRHFLKIENQWLGGIKDDKNQHPGSAGILIFFRWFLLKQIKENNLLDMYDRFIITRSDFMYQLPHPSIELLNSGFIWIPDGEHYGGLTDRHVVLSRDHVEPYLNILNTMTLKSNDYFMKMQHKSDWNLEQVIKFHLQYNNCFDRVKHFPYVMYSVRNINGSSRWSLGKFSRRHGFYIKYISEFHESSKFKNMFDNEGLTVFDFFSTLIAKC